MGGSMTRVGRPPSCECGECPKCIRRLKARERWQAMTLDERREVIARRDPEKTRAADRARHYRDRERRLASIRDYAQRKPEVVRAGHQRWVAANPDKRAAQVAVGNAVRDGRLVKGHCALVDTGQCGGRIEAHHEDYTRPLDVVWLCQRHHRATHGLWVPPIEEVHHADV